MSKNREVEKNKRAKYAKKMRSKKKHGFRKFILSFFIIVIITGAALCVTVLFPIAEISVQGESIYSMPEIIEASGIVPGDNMFLLGGNTSSRIVKKLPYIKSASYKRIFPDKLVIVVQATKAEKCYYNGEIYVITDDTGKILEISGNPTESLIQVRADFDGKIKVAHTMVLSNNTQKSSLDNILYNFKASGIKLDSVDVSDTLNIRLTVEGRFIAELGDYSELPGKLAHMKAMIGNIDKSATGVINLKSWTSEKTEGYFTNKNITESEQTLSAGE